MLSVNMQTVRINNKNVKVIAIFDMRSYVRKRFQMTISISTTERSIKTSWGLIFMIMDSDNICQILVDLLP